MLALWRIVTPLRVSESKVAAQPWHSSGAASSSMRASRLRAALATSGLQLVAFMQTPPVLVDASYAASSGLEKIGEPVRRDWSWQQATSDRDNNYPRKSMSITRTFIVGAAVSLAALSAQAQDAAAKPAAQPAATTDKTPGSGPNPFTDCGIGAALFPSTHWAALSSNVIWDLGITAITSATASPQTCSGKKVAAAAFIRETYERLAEETARGEGEHLATVLNILECRGEQQVVAASATRDAMAPVVSQPEFGTLPRIEKAARFYQAVESAVAKSCAV